MNNKDLVAILEKCIENDLGDLGRTQYLIKRIKKNQVIFQSDRLYLDRLLKFQQSEIQEKIELEDPFQTKLETGFFNSLIKCNKCSTEIQFNQKAVRSNQFWFHEKCIELQHPQITTEPQRKAVTRQIETVIPKMSQVQPPSERLIAKPKKSSGFIPKPEKIIVTRTTKPQIIFTASILASLVVSVYYLLGEVIASAVGVGGTSIFIVTYKSKIKSFNNKRKYITESTELIKSGIPGFEEYLMVGLKKNSSVLISGPAGSGKTTFGLQFLYYGAKDFDEPGIYVTLSQNIEDTKNDCKSFGWDFDDLIQKDKILMIDARPFRIQDEALGKDDSLYRGEQLPFEHLTKLLLNGIKKINAQRVVIDSVTILTMQYHDKFNMRQGLQAMIQALENSGVTSFIISEFSKHNEVPLEWFVTSGIIQLHHTRIDDTMERSIQITKMRGIKHSEQIHPIALGSDGLYVFDADKQN